MELSDGEEKKFKKLTAQLKKQSLPPNLCENFNRQPEQVVLMRQEGIITDAEFKKYGPTLILDYIFGMNELSNENRRQMQSRADRNEAEHVEKLRNKQAETGGDLRRRVNWDSNIVDALLAVDVGAVAHPSVIRKQRPPQVREPWLDVDTFFEILESGLEAVEEEKDEVFGLFECTSLSG
ncbi:hypothetical protein FB567DRAFT_587983 [Paraphoma chrysanthemicola]|uniref:Uncharacterized protein n=1 Tax=Paraphoma chrysanthemicola TaxID=798071 RepID=A0A8K0RGD0_9PLEO|nr:hypothetical protein FB567DRAFT_587983 [Paraphoma chrysanthemicola]